MLVISVDRCWILIGRGRGGPILFTVRVLVFEFCESSRVYFVLAGFEVA